MYNYYREDWLIDRLAGTVQAAFGHTPCVDLPGGGQAVVTAALDQTNQVCGNHYVPPAPSSRRPPTTVRSCTTRAARSPRSTCGRWPGSC